MGSVQGLKMDWFQRVAPLGGRVYKWWVCCSVRRVWVKNPTNESGGS